LPVGTPQGDYITRLVIYDDAGRYNADLPLSVGAWNAQEADWSDTTRALYVLPVSVEIPQDNVTLIGHSGDASARNGDALTVVMLWRGQGDAPDLTLTGEGWEIEIPTLNAVQGYLLDVRVVRLPLDAPSGAAELRLPDGTVIAQYTIENVPAVYTAPVFEQSPVSAATFAPVGEIVGFDLADAQIGQPLEVTLIWRAQAATPTSYTVFVQVIDAGGRVIAQSDALPAGGARPTTGWRAGEYITDTHSLRWNDQAAPGTARLIAGLYDAATGERLHLADGGDLAVLVTELIVR
jgi:hypothetical protein